MISPSSGECGVAVECLAQTGLEQVAQQLASAGRWRQWNRMFEMCPEERAVPVLATVAWRRS